MKDHLDSTNATQEKLLTSANRADEIVAQVSAYIARKRQQKKAIILLGVGFISAVIFGLTADLSLAAINQQCSSGNLISKALKPYYPQQQLAICRASTYLANLLATLGIGGVLISSIQAFLSLELPEN